MRGLFINDLGACNIAPFKIKCIDPVTTAALIGAGASLASGVFSSTSAANMNAASRDYDWMKTNELMYYNDEQAEKARQGQRDLLIQEQNWNEQMYNLYNSPSAMMRQYREAGMNPYLVDAQPSHGQSLGSPSAPSTAQASAPSTGQPPIVAPDFSGFSKAGEMYLMAKQVDANVANTSAKTLKEAAEAYTSLRGHGMSSDDAKSLVMPFFKGSQGMDSDSDKFFGMLNLDYQGKVVSNKRSELAYELDKYYSPKERQAKLDETDQLVSESVARIGKMSSDAKLNEAEIKHLAQDCVESLSRIYRNNAEGSLADVQGLNIMTLLPYLESSAQFQGEKEEFDSETTYGNSSIRKFSKSRFGKALNIFLYYLGRGMNAGNIGVNVGAKVGK